MGMGDLPARARVVVIGGGAVGVSALYHLALAGWTDAVLIERNELTAGSTWHAAGNVPTFSASWSIMAMQRYSAELYRGLAERVGYPMNYHVTGSIRLAHGEERLREFARVVGMGRYQGMELALLTPAEVRDRYPFIATHDIRGALWDPSDGDIDPAQLTQALARGARDLGATIVRFCKALGARRDGADWVVATEEGEIRCAKVVNAAGYRAREVGAWFGRDLPLVTMGHQYLVFDTVPEVEAWSRQAGRKLPLLRDVDVSYYLRQEKFGFNLGPYEPDCRAYWVAPAEPMPEDFSFQLFPDELDRIAPIVEDAMRRVPVLAGAGLQRVINGPIPYAPDGNPLLGPMPGVPDAYEACAFTFGICQAGGAGKVLAEWVTQGRTEWDMWSCDPRRFGAYADQGYALAKAVETYGHEYAIHFPRHAWPAGRPRLVSAVHDKTAALGAQFGAMGGWERALWYARPGDDISEAATQSWRRDGPWQARIAEECAAVEHGCGLLDLPGFSRFVLDGPGARAWLLAQATGRLPAPGRLGLLYFADDDGRLVTEMSAMALAEDEFLLITAAAARQHDRDWLAAHLPPGLGLRDESEDWSCQIVTGPRARAVLGPVTDADLARPWLSHQEARLGGRLVRLARVSFAGELGWEIHSRVEDTPAVWDALWQAGQPLGLRPFGMWALDSLRIEKGYRAWKQDLSTDYSVLECGLERFVDWSKPEFRGRAALAAERQQGVAKRFAVLTVADGGFDPPYMSSLWQGERIVGETTSAAWGHRVGACVALGMVRADLARPGTRIEVEAFGDRLPATVAGCGPLYDAGNERLKA
jgi:dimethylglycine dehydrogenase